MLVRELVQLLKTCPQDAEVVVILGEDVPENSPCGVNDVNNTLADLEKNQVTIEIYRN